MIDANRHDRGWPKETVLTWIEITDQSRRLCVLAMGRRDTLFHRGDYMELIQFLRRKTEDR
jgi:hypothetical protein